MKNKRLLKTVAKTMCALTVCTGVVTPLMGCKKDGISNETTPLVLATDVLDGVFNPFFYTSGTDGEIVGQTQIGMLTSDEDGQPDAGWDEACVAFDYSVVTTGNKDLVQGNDYSRYYTDYYFAIKDNVKFSDGVLLTMNDVLFNVYMYLDPAYTGSSTMYSVAIKGINKYRTQTDSEGDQNASDSYFNSLTDTRINSIKEWATNDEEGDWGAWSNYENPKYPNTMEKDILQIHSLFKEELESDWRNSESIDAEKEYVKYKDQSGKLLITTHEDVFLYQYGILVMVPHYGDDGKIAYYEKQNNYPFTDYSQDKVINYVYARMFDSYENASKTYKQNLLSAITQYATASTFRSYVRADVIQRELAGSQQFKNREGVMPEKLTEIPTAVDAEGNVTATRELKDAEGNNRTFDVLHIRIDGVDPKAIQNFSFTVAPGHYYGKDWDNVDGVNYFGVKFANYDFMNEVRANQVPLGAGPYRASAENGKANPAKSEFYKDKAVFLERNDYFLLGKPKIKKLRYKVVYNNMLYNVVKTGEVHYASPSLTANMIASQLEGSDKSKVQYAMADNLGYGYIGISAQYINNIYIRRAIMSTLDAQECVDYYGGGKYASRIARPMSRTLKDYYPTDVTDLSRIECIDGSILDYEYDSQAEPADRGAKALAFALEGGATQRNGLLYLDNKPLKYTFTIAGDSDDHPANALLLKSADILNDIGFQITVTHDSQALAKLANGQLTVWAAAWSSSSDPDMYQVYHKNSSATSTKAWGYSYLTSSLCDDYQRGILDTLSDYIMEGRETTDKNERKATYNKALNALMELAVEFPTYQRKVFYVWQKGLLDESTMFAEKEGKTYRSPLSEIWNVSFIEG